MSDTQLIKFRDILWEAEKEQIIPIKKTTKFKDHEGKELKIGQRIALAIPGSEYEARVTVGVLEGIYHDRTRMYFKLDNWKFMHKSGHWLYQWETKDAGKYDMELNNVAIL